VGIISVVWSAVCSVQNPASRLFKEVELATVARCKCLVPRVGLAPVGVVLLLPAIAKAS
jgi:hypothetical protein